MSPIGKANKAFTLIEVLLVIVIMAIVIAIAVPNFSGTSSGLHLRKTVEDLRALARWAQAMAIAQNRIYAVSINESGRSYSVVQAIMDENGGNQFQRVPGTIGRMRTLPAEVSLKSDVDLVQFYPTGNIDPAIIELSSGQRKSTLSSVHMRGVMTVIDDE